MALKRTLAHMKYKLGATPTVLNTGRGYHILQPIDCPYLENLPNFNTLLDTPSQDFLKFFEDYFTLGKADNGHKPSFRNMMLRVPYSINSKPDRNNHVVSIKQEGHGNRIKITAHLLVDFQ